MKTSELPPTSNAADVETISPTSKLSENEIATTSDNIEINTEKPVDHNSPEDSANLVETTTLHSNHSDSEMHTDHNNNSSESTTSAVGAITDHHLNSTEHHLNNTTELHGNSSHAEFSEGEKKGKDTTTEVAKNGHSDP